MRRHGLRTSQICHPTSQPKKHKISRPASGGQPGIAGFVARLMDHLVSGRQQRFRDGEAKRLGGLEVSLGRVKTFPVLQFEHNKFAFSVYD
jgi:hypothetical protein